MVHKETVRSVVGIIGNVISFGLFLSPVPTFVKIWKAKSVQSFKPDPYVATLLNCLLWVFYGLPIVKADSILISTINGIGLVIEGIYILMFIIYSDWGKRRKIFLYLAIEVIFYAAVLIVSLAVLHPKGRANLVGILCLIFNIIMYFSPLTVMKMVITTKSVKFMPFYLSLANFVNGAIWFCYAFLKFDVYVVIPNGLGALSGAIQLILYACYYKTTNWDEEEKEEDKPAGDVQLSKTGNQA